ncbi:MAG: ribosome biogenesis GTPase YlqF [Peptococcaceae bacterium]|nr:ribosome biogenesis GTPase YlqF [Peptococcaceae bacterium]
MTTQTIQWFPGHMAKTRRLMAENLKLVDVVIVMLDARLPKSSSNPLIDELVAQKPRVLVLAKADLAEERLTAEWIKVLEQDGARAVACDFKGGSPKYLKKVLTEAIWLQAGEVLERRVSRGITNTTIRVMVTGIPNVGKSTLINMFAGKNRAETGDKPGVTRGKQWVRLDRDLELLDMPGILWPNIQDREAAHKLAVTGAVGDNAYDFSELGVWLVGWLRKNRPGRLAARYGISEEAGESAVARVLEELRQEQEMLAGREKETEGGLPPDLESIAILEAIGIRRGFLRKGGVVEKEKAAAMLLDELRGGKLGPVTWDLPDQGD